MTPPPWFALSRASRPTNRGAPNCLRPKRKLSDSVEVKGNLWRMSAAGRNPSLRIRGSRRACRVVVRLFMKIGIRYRCSGFLCRYGPTMCYMICINTHIYIYSFFFLFFHFFHCRSLPPFVHLSVMILIIIIIIAILTFF